MDLNEAKITIEKDRLYCGDCLELMKGIPDGSIDMILCDLPYGTTGSKWDVVIDKYKLWENYNRIISKNGAIVLFGTEPFCTIMRASNIEMYKYDWIWRKTTVTGFAHANNMPLRDYENIMVFSKGAINHKNKTKNRMEYNPQGLQECKQVDFAHKTSSILHSGTFVNSIEDRYIRTKTGYPRMVLEYKKKASDTKYHINAKPVALLEYLIKTYTNEGETVLDNCMGSGSTCVAAINTNRHYIGIEKEQKYFDIACKRIEEAISQKDGEC